MYPIIFHLGSVTVYSLGVFLVLAYLLATFIFWKEGRKQCYREEKLLDLSLISLIAAFIGGRLLFVLIHSELFRGNLPSIFAFWEGGLTFYGALSGILIAGYLTCRKWKWPLLQIADFGALSALAAYTLVKIGTFFAGTDVGILTNLPWGVQFVTVSSTRHPVQLYEAIFVGVAFILMRIAYEKNIKSASFRSGKIFFFSVFLLFFSRFLFGFLREDFTYLFGEKLDLIISLLVAIVAIFSIYYLGLRDLKSDFEVLVKNILSINTRALRKMKFWG